MNSIYGLVVSRKKLLIAFVLIVFGVSCIFYGLTALYIDQTRFASEISDAEIIERAKKLGMVDLKEYLNRNGE